MEPKVKIELMKKTCQFTGSVYYYVAVNGIMQSDTWTTDESKARVSLVEVAEKVRLHPQDIYESLETVEV